MFMPYLLAGLIAYILGSINSSVLVGNYIFKTDARKYGSKNPGTCNSVYVYGFLGGIMVFLFDLSKGFFSLLIVDLLFKNSVANLPQLLLFTGFFAVLGHCKSLFLRFKGGKGFATYAGVFYYLFPTVAAILTIVFAIVVLTSKYITLGTFTVVGLFPIVHTYQSVTAHTFHPLILAIILAISAVVVIRHRENMVKLIQGREQSIVNTRISPEELQG